MYLDNSGNWNFKRCLSEADKKFFWLREDRHNTLPLTPMTATDYYEAIVWGSCIAAEKVKFPTMKGLDYRFFKGRVYLNPIAITDEEELKTRQPIFEDNLKKVLMDWDEVYSGYVQKWNENLEYLKNLSIESASWQEIEDYFSRANQILQEHWVDHLFLTFTTIPPFFMFEEFCGRFGISDMEALKCVQGFDQKMNEGEREVWKLSKMAQDNDEIRGLFSKEGSDIFQALKGSAAGAEWVRSFNAFLEEYGLRTVAGEFEYGHPTWQEDPGPALEIIKSYIMDQEADFERKQNSIVEDREKSIKAAMEKITSDEDLNMFQQFLMTAQKTYTFSEDHNFYIEHGTCGNMRKFYMAIGRRLVELGIIDNPDDTLFMTKDELMKLVHDLADNYDVALTTNGIHFHALVTVRRKEWEQLCSEPDPPLIIGTPPSQAPDPIVIKLVGISPKMFEAPPEEQPDVIEGAAVSQGVAEGIARVINDPRDYKSIKPGDILVCPFTSPAWTPLFSKIKAIVTDAGGLLSHPAIMARQNQIPGVCATWHASSIIKDGQRIKVDGNEGKVYILK